MARLSYIVCTSPRSGSTLLTSALGATGVAGKPEEYGNPGLYDEITMMRRLGAHDEREYIDRVLKVSTTTNGVFGTKLHAFQTPFILGKINAHQGTSFVSLREALETEFPNLHYIFLTRDDKVAQAVSYYRALMTGEWWRRNGRSAPASDAEIPFSQFGIKRCLQLVEASEAYWKEYFRVHAISPLSLTYDDVSHHYDDAVKKTLRFLELPDDVVPPEQTQRIADKRSLQWIESFRELERESPVTLATPAPSWAAF